ncbi:MULTISPECIES: SDR family oxidoreductase [Salimicrobium]|uniref:NADP-dependent 3-hydroxy acid dehydrogenase YdfG n=2 Tax=Salimicrobium TaxID=351195 RepID=A0ABY1KK37_9BACI|nr:MULTISPECIES: SDR family oxidoreductase [Salimicrobium]SDX48249.1 NADP-dependent 3-hydroxy acid dehydrogenase YdfG [Salimicrobium album]SIS44269.1 NADP-dependent 3-hydroxy acid dehydrogenase YdfG [Salimicrobium salexigens]
MKNEIVVITGASRGIGRAAAFHFAKAGARLTVTGSSEDIYDTKKSLEEAGFNDVVALVSDVTREGAMEQIIHSTINTYGRVDVLINNAGVGKFQALEDITLEEWKKMFEVNVQGVFLATKSVIPQMKKQQSGTILTVASDVSRYSIPENGSLYTATKYAVQGFMGSVAQELKPFGIRVGTINPGMTDTNFAGGTEGDPEKKDWLKADDVAAGLLHMASAPKHMQVDEMHIHPLAQDYPRP